MKGSPVSTNSRTKSRRKTPWDDTSQEQLTPTELYVKRTFLDRYQERHPSLSEAEEADLVNYYVPECCPYCGSMNFVRNGYNPYGIIRYKCECGKRFRRVRTEMNLEFRPRENVQKTDDFLLL